MKNIEPTEALDAALIPSGQYVEHYEMAGYLGAITLADQLGERQISAHLRTTLKEEEAADKKLATIALKDVNTKLS